MQILAVAAIQKLKGFIWYVRCLARRIKYSITCVRTRLRVYTDVLVNGQMHCSDVCTVHVGTANLTFHM